MDPDDTLIIHSAAELVTCAAPDGLPKKGKAQAEAGIIHNGAVVIRGEHIVAVGTSMEIVSQYRDENTRLVDATGKTVTPGLVDAHTHLVWAGWRDEEYEMRLRGASYLEIMERGRWHNVHRALHAPRG